MLASGEQTWLCACSGLSQVRQLENLGFVFLASSHSFKGQGVYHLSLKELEENRKLGVLSVIQMAKTMLNANRQYLYVVKYLVKPCVLRP